MNFKRQLKEGLLTKNPVLAQLLGMCSTMAITTTLFNGLGMGLSVTLILICSNVLISLLRKVIPGSIRIAAYVVIISGFVTMVDLLLQAYLPALSEGLGVFIPLIVVNCIILGRAEAFASKNGRPGLCCGRSHSGTGLHRGPGGHVYHPGASGKRHLRRRTPERGRGNSRSARSISRHAFDSPLRRIFDLGLSHCLLPVAFQSPGPAAAGAGS